MKDYLKPRTWKLRLAEDGGPALSEPEIKEQVEQLVSETGLSPLTVRICLMRGLETAESISEFLSPTLDRLKHPLQIQDMKKAASRVAAARESKEKVLIFGDYDVDGTTGAALLSWVFRDFGLCFTATQPDRFKDGYGLNVGAVEQAAQAGVGLIVSVDCGITSFEAAERAQELGVDLVVLDHHQVDPKRGLPPAFAICNPQREDCGSGLRQLCGCGIAFYFSIALRAHGREAGWFVDGKGPNLKQHLDLVVMATAADMVPLTGDNRVLVAVGMEVLKRSEKPGVRALMEVAGLVNRSVSPGHLGFVLGPRINASGRMDSASLALEMLTTRDSVRGVQLAHELERLNQERADLQNKIWDEIRERVTQEIDQGRFQHGIVVGDPGWHEGVVGIVASRVTETFRRPAIVISLREDLGKGSARSYGGRDVLAAIRSCEELLIGFGGHRFAAGLSLKPDQVEAFAEAFDRALALAEPEKREELPLLIEGRCELEDLDVRSLEEIERLGPFGPGNPEPVFTLRAEIARKNVLKGRHLKLNLSAPGSSRTRTIEAIWFNAAERKDVMQQMDSGEETSFAGVPELNRFRGRATPSFRVRDWKSN